MALINCKECSEEISDKAGKCPKCGAPLPDPNATLKGIGGCGCLLLALFIIIWIMGMFGDSSDDKSPTAEQPSGIKVTTNQWFQGGNLNNATVTEWKSATDQNKLATAADWLVATKWDGHLNSLDDFDKLKVKAQMLADAVDEVVAVDQTDSLLQLNEIAAAIITMSNDLGP